MEKIQILGLGPGNLDYTLPIVLKKIKESEVIVGGKRHIESLGECAENKEYCYISADLQKVLDFINENRNKKISVVVSGDTGFYSLLTFMKKHFESEELEVVPGISSVQYMFAKISEYWYDACIASVHGKEFDFVEKLNEYEKIGLLKNNFEDVKIFVGENLSYENEKIYCFKTKELANYKEKFGMNVVILKK